MIRAACYDVSGRHVDTARLFLDKSKEANCVNVQELAPHQQPDFRSLAKMISAKPRLDHHLDL